MLDFLKAKMHQIRFPLPHPLVELTALPRPIVVFKGTTSMGRDGKGEGGKGEENGREMRGEGRGGEGGENP